MQKKRLIIIILLVSSVIALSSCVRSASNAPGDEDSSTSAQETFPIPGTEEDLMTQLEQFATQTAMALEEQTPQPTPTSGVVDTGTTPQATDVLAQTATSTIVAIATATPGTPTEYTLEEGEHIYCIARRYNVNPNELLNLNGLNSNSFVYAGLTLSIPQTGNPFPSNRTLKSHPVNYTVIAYDTIYSIACQFGDVDPNDIIAANSMSAPYTLTAGQNLHIP